MDTTQEKSVDIEELDQLTKNRIARAWKCTLDQCFEKSKTTSEKEGPGLSIFKFLRSTKRDSNCHYLYTEKNGLMWKSIMDISPEGGKIQELYDPTTMTIICVKVPIGLQGDKLIGNVKLFDSESKKEIDTSSDPLQETESKPEENKEYPTENLGLHQRKNIKNSDDNSS